MKDNNWGQGTLMSQNANHHMMSVQKLFEKEISDSVKDTLLFEDTDWPTYFPNTIDTNWRITFPFEVSALKSQEAAYREYVASDGDSRICILNFASFKNPGGQFLNGAMAQEEQLCHVSALYNVLRCFEKDFYRKNAKMLNHAMYQNRSLYSPAIPFKNDVWYYADVLTCAAPNMKTVMKYHPELEEAARKAMLSRIIHVVKVILKMQLLLPKSIDRVILGAFGCGVFGNDVCYVANSFCRALQIAYQSMKDAGREKRFPFIEFAVPILHQGDSTYEKFTSETNRLMNIDAENKHVHIRDLDEIYESFI